MKAIERLARCAKIETNFKDEIELAYALGMRWKQIPPDREVEIFYTYYAWLEKAQEFRMGNWVLRFFSEDGKDWHELYQDLRRRGWERAGVYREGGELRYLMVHQDESLPVGEWFKYLVLHISIATCKQVLVRTEMKEVPVYETVCEDLKEIEDDQSMGSTDLDPEQRSDDRGGVRDTDGEAVSGGGEENS